MKVSGENNSKIFKNIFNVSSGRGFGYYNHKSSLSNY